MGPMERPMVRRFIRDSLLYWLQEFQIDGFRFDLLGMHHPESVRDWEKALRQVRSDVLLYGEPWTGGGPTHFGKGAQRGMGVAVFNDTFRGAIRGDTDGSGPGFATGAKIEYDLLNTILAGSLRMESGGPGFTDRPSESVNYVSAHDNLTLWDKVQHTLPEADEKEQARAIKLATAAVLVSQGIPFLEGGVEIGRTKQGNHNSYNATDEVNAFHWDRAAEFQGVHAYVQGMIAIRKMLQALRMNDAARIRNELQFLDPAILPTQTVAFRLPGHPRWTEALVVLHGSRVAAEMKLPDGGWSILADADVASAAPIGKAEGTSSTGTAVCLRAGSINRGSGRHEAGRLFGRSVFIREGIRRQSASVFADLDGPGFRVIQKSLAIAGKERARRFLEPTKITTHRVHEAESRFAGTPDAVLAFVGLPSVLHEFAQGHGSPARLFVQPIPVAWKKGDFSSNHTQSRTARTSCGGIHGFRFRRGGLW